MLLVSATCLYAQKKDKDFAPLNPALKYWQGEETYYTESNRLSLDFAFDDKKVMAMTVLNETNEREMTLFQENGRYKGDILLDEGTNELLVWATKKKGKFQKKLRVFYNPYTSAVSFSQGNCAIRIYGNYNLTPQVGSDDIVINRYSKSEFPVHFLVSCCEDEGLRVTVENPKNQPVPTKRIAPNLYAFDARLYDYQNSFVVRASCDGSPVAQRRITIKVDQEMERRKDTAIIFAVSKHTKEAKRLGWADLRYSQEDAEALKWTLEEKFGFGVSIISDPTWEQINESMEGLRRHHWNRLDQLLIFFTGHGYKSPEGVGYLVPSNVGKSLKTLYKMEDLRAQIDALACNNIVLGIDACFASSFLERGGTDIPTRKGLDIHHLLSSDAPFRYFIGSAPSNKEVPEKGVFNKEVREADGKYRYRGKKFKVSEFMMAFLEAIEMGEEEFAGNPIPIWYVGRKVEELYRPKKKGAEQTYARTARFGTQQDKGFHFISKNILLQ